MGQHPMSDRFTKNEGDPPEGPICVNYVLASGRLFGIDPTFRAMFHKDMRRQGQTFIDDPPTPCHDTPAARPSGCPDTRPWSQLCPRWRTAQVGRAPCEGYPSSPRA